MTNEQNAKRLEEISACPLCMESGDTPLLRESAAMLRERDGVRWVDSMFGYSVCIYRGYAICVVGYEGWHAFNRVKDQYEKGFFPTLDAAKAAAIAWVDGQEGK